MKGFLVIIEGSDSSGKATQALSLYNRLINEKYDVMRVDFPNYKSDSSILVKMYLNGEFGDSADDVNAYAASTFYAVDRFASYKKEWERFFREGGIIVADRYTTSNMIHQAAKIKDPSLKDEYLNWLWDLEFVKFGLPIPDCVFFLDMPPEYSRKLMENRNNKITGSSEKDIHEKDADYLINSYNNSRYVADRYQWVKIDCVENGRIKTIESIHEAIFSYIKNILPGRSFGK